MLVRCQRCKGAKTMNHMGGQRKECDGCGGFGHLPIDAAIKIDQPKDVVTHQVELAPPSAIVSAKPKGRGKKNEQKTA